MTAAVRPSAAAAPIEQGLRLRKKERTRFAIQDAALDLFIEHGFEETTIDAIAQRADVSRATFFRYFANKGDVIFGGEGYRHDSLRATIVGRPTGEDDVTAVRRAILENWLPTVDPSRFARQTRAARTSPLLRGLSSDLGERWQAVVSEALSERRGLPEADQRCRIVAGIAFVAMSSAVNAWVQTTAPSSLADELDRAFALVTDICDEVAAPAHGRRGRGG